MSNFNQTIKSVLAALFGVQSEKNRQVDFSQGKLTHFIIVGIVVVAIFIAALITVASLVLPNS